MSRRSSRASVSDGEFFTDCKAAYVEVVKDVRKDITSKSLLLQALQESGRNPSERVLKKYWNSSTDGISFDDFVDICRKEHVTSDDEMMKAFRKIDTNGDGYLSLDELFKIMTSKGEKMTRQEVREIIDEVDENGDGKLDYKEFCNMNRATADQLRQRNRKRLERVEKGDRRNKKVESFSDSKRGDVASMGSQISVKSNSSQRTSTSRMMGSSSSLRSESVKTAEHDDEDAMEEIPEALEESDDDDDIQTSMTPSDIRRHSIKSAGSSFKTSTESEMGSRTSLRSSRGSSAYSYKSRKGQVEGSPFPRTKQINTRSSASVTEIAESNSRAGIRKSLTSLYKSTGSELESEKQHDKKKSPRKPSVSEDLDQSIHQTLNGSSASFSRSVSARSASVVKSYDSFLESESEQESRYSRKTVSGSSPHKSMNDEQESGVQTSVRGSSSCLRKSLETEIEGPQVSVKSKKAENPVFYAESNKRHGDDDDEDDVAEEIDEEEEVVMTSSRRRSSAGSKTDLSSSYKSRIKSSGELIHGSHASLRSAGMSGSRRSLLSIDDMPRPSPRSNKKGVKHVPASKLGHLTEEPKNKRDWTKTTSKGCFFIDEDDGLMTHTYRLNLNERSKVWITVQPSIPQSMIIGDTTPIDTMLLVTKKKPDSEGRSVVGFTEKRDGKGKYGVMCELKAGSYNLLPFTTGCHLKARRSDSSKETPLVRKDRDGKTSITKAFRKALEEIFELSDLDGNGTLSRDEFTWFTLRTSGDKVTDDEWAVVEDTVELENNEITKKGFVKLNEMEADDVDDDISDLWVTLNSMGYNKDLFIDEACPYKLDVYTESCDDAEVALTCTGIETINNDMIIETVMEQDEGVKIKGSVYMYTYANDTRSTVVLSNRSNNSVNVTMDCTSSKNCQISQDNEEYTVTLDPHEKQIAHHLMPLDETLDWTPRCVEAVTK